MNISKSIPTNSSKSILQQETSIQTKTDKQKLDLQINSTTIHTESTQYKTIHMIQ